MSFNISSCTLQDLPPRWVHSCLAIERFATRHLRISLGGEQLLVGLSGGLDSSILLLVCACLSARGHGRIVAAHLDHCLRPKSSQDAEHARALAQALDIPFRSIKIDVVKQAKERGLGLEDAGRQARHKFFCDILEQDNLDWIVLGHHLNDLAEDICLRLVRGSGWPGLSGMSGRDDGLRILRPFLLTPKVVLQNLAKDIRLTWCEDETNQKLIFRRNRMRRNVIPILLEENPRFLKTIARLWYLGRIDQDYWSKKIKISSGHLSDSPMLSNSTLKKKHLALRLRLYKYVLDNLGPGQVLSETIFQLDMAWQKNRLGTVFQFPGSKLAKVTQDGIKFFKKMKIK